MSADGSGGPEVFNMPSLGADMEHGVIVEWRIAPGEHVHRGQIVAVVETEKSEIEVETFRDAVVTELLVPVGERVAVGAPIARMAAEAHPFDEPRPVSAPQPVAEPPSPVSSPVLRHLVRDLGVDASTVHGTGAGGRVHRDDVLAAAPHRSTADEPAAPRRRITPRARRLAQERGLEIGAIEPGHAGVVTGADVLAAGEQQRRAPDSLRQAIAALMSRSWREIPHFHVQRRLDIHTCLDELERSNDQRSVHQRVLPAAVLLSAVARAAARFGAINGWWIDGHFEPAEQVDLGVVVARRQGGVLVPTIGAADRLDLDEMMEALGGVVARVRAGRLRRADTARASLTVTNLGDLGSDVVHGVIHPPQVALVGFGAIHDAAVVVDDRVVARRVVQVSLAGDHRALDGLVAARFLDRLAAELASVHGPGVGVGAVQSSSTREGGTDDG